MLVAVLAVLAYLATNPFSWHRPPSPPSITIVMMVDKLAEKQAKDAVQLAHDNYDIDLDYSDRSIADVEHVLDSLQHRWFKHNDQWSSWFGFYVGEVLRRKHGAVWIVQQNPDGKTRPALRLSSAQTPAQIVDPVGQCRKRLESGSAYDVSAYYASVVKSLNDHK
jgi:hypothetical protein